MSKRRGGERSTCPANKVEKAAVEMAGKVVKDAGFSYILVRGCKHLKMEIKTPTGVRRSMPISSSVRYDPTIHARAVTRYAVKLVAELQSEMQTTP